MGFPIQLVALHYWQIRGSGDVFTQVFKSLWFCLCKNLVHISPLVDNFPMSRHFHVVQILHVVQYCEIVVHANVSSRVAQFHRLANRHFSNSLPKCGAYACLATLSTLFMAAMCAMTRVVAAKLKRVKMDISTNTNDDDTTTTTTTTNNNNNNNNVVPQFIDSQSIPTDCWPHAHLTKPYPWQD